NIDIKGNEKPIPLKNLLTIEGFENIPFTLEGPNEDRVVYSYSSPEWKIVRTYEKVDESSIRATIAITNKSNVSRLENFRLIPLTKDTNKIDSRNDRSAMLNEISILENNKVFRRNLNSKLLKRDNKLFSGNIQWVGFRNHYHAILLKPEFETKTI